MRKGMTKRGQEIEVIAPVGYDEGDILWCEYVVESKGGEVKKKGTFCAKSGKSSVDRVIGRFAQKANVFKITIVPIKKIGEANK